jgi:hypothetical protein
MLFVFYENGDIMTWGEQVPGGVFIELPGDWAEYSVAKYVANEDRTGLTVRPGWVDPEPES